MVRIENCAPQIHVYQLNEDEPSDELDEEDATTNSQMLLPSKELTGLWDRCIARPTSDARCSNEVNYLV